MPKPCPCVFCHNPGRTALPALVRVTYERHARWAWLLCHEEDGTVLLQVTEEAPHTRYGYELRRYTSLREAAAGVVPADVSDAELRKMWGVKLEDGTCVRLDKFKVYGHATVMPTSHGRKAKCTNFELTTTTTAVRKRVRSPPAAAAARAPAAAAAAAAPAIPLPVTEAYDLGGDPEHVAEILEARPEWDQETVEELLRWGAKPRLVRVARVVEHVHYKTACCVFVQPTGRTVENIWLPFGTLLLEYPEHVRQLP